MMKVMPRRRFLAFLGGTGLVASYPVCVEPYLIVKNTYRIPVPNLPAAFAGFRMVHLTDLHYGPLVPLAMIRHVVRRSNRIERDVVVCTGDYVHMRRSGDVDTVWPALGKLEAPSGVFSVLGNHDHWSSTQRSLHWLRETGQDLRHKTVAIERDGAKLWFAGAGDYWEDHLGLDELLEGIPDEDCRIVLAHNPETADTPFSARVDLMVSGHTHGGQVKIPFRGAPVLPVSNKTYSSGLKTSPRGTKVFISRGIGWAIYPVRFNCYPEIAVLELVPAEATG